MQHITVTRVLGHIILALLVLVAIGTAVASAASPAESRRMEGQPTPTAVVPWSSRCYTDTCVGFVVPFGGHTVALGHPSDAPGSWAIRASDDLPSLVATYPALPAWYLAALPTSVARDPPISQRWLPVLRC